MHRKKGIVILTSGLLFEFLKSVHTVKSQIGVYVSGGGHQDGGKHISSE